MSKTHLQNLQSQKLRVQLQLDRLKSKITFHNRDYHGLRNKELMEWEADEVALTKHLNRLEEEIGTEQSRVLKKKAPQQKQERIYEAVEKMLKKNKNKKKEKCFEDLADKTGDSQEAIRKAYFAEQKKIVQNKAGNAKKIGD